VESDQGPEGKPYALAHALALNDGVPFGIGGLWENWKDPVSGEWIRYVG
jgi:hypothetical protein